MIRQTLMLAAVAALSLSAAGCNRDADKSGTPKSGASDSMMKPDTPSTPPSTGAPGSNPPQGGAMSPGTPEKKGTP